MQTPLTQDVRSYFKRLWTGKLTSVENIGFFLPVWLWFTSIVLVETLRLSPEPLFVAFLIVFPLSTVPFFRRRVGLLRLGIYGWLVPAAIITFVLSLLRIGH